LADRVNQCFPRPLGRPVGCCSEYFKRLVRFFLTTNTCFTDLRHWLSRGMSLLRLLTVSLSNSIVQWKNAQSQCGAAILIVYSFVVHVIKNLIYRLKTSEHRMLNILQSIGAFTITYLWLKHKYTLNNVFPSYKEQQTVTNTELNLILRHQSLTAQAWSLQINVAFTAEDCARQEML